jgi:hypothetical protein
MFDRNQMIAHILDRLENATNAELEAVYWMVEMEVE